MTQEDKELLLKDLCGRLPYGVKVKVPETVSMNALKVYAIERMYYSSFYCKRNGIICKFWNNTFARLDEIKPYLRPMGSMTDEEYEKYYSFLDANLERYSTKEDARDLIDFLNAHHFDYRGLIEKGLAIEVTEDNNPYKE